MTTLLLGIETVQFVKELYPRLREDDAAIERYRLALDRLPPIVVARGHVLVDGFHRWQAHRKEQAAQIPAIDLGNLTDAEIRRESIVRNATHGQQLSQADKKRLAGVLWRDFAAMKNGEREAEILALLSVTDRTLREWTKDARKQEREEQEAAAWDLWLNCQTQDQIAKDLGVPQQTISGWLTEFGKSSEFGKPPESRQHFDLWQFGQANGDSAYFGKLPPQVVENLLWLYTEPGQVVVDPFVGGGTTIDVAKRMGRRVWASDRSPSTPTLPIHQHDIRTGWPKKAPSRADLILLDPPYWQQAKGRYSDSPDDLANMTLPDFYAAWSGIVRTCVRHLAPGGRLAYIVSPTQCDDGRVVDHATDMLDACRKARLVVKRRVIVPYQTQQATGQQVTWAREHRRLLKLYRDLVILERVGV